MAGEMGEVNPADAMESNRSLLNPQDGMVLMGRAAAGGLPEDASLAEFMQSVMGIDVNAPWQQELSKFMDTQLTNKEPLGKLRNIAEGNNVRPGAGAVAERDVARTMAPTPEPEFSGGLDGILDRM